MRPCRATGLTGELIPADIKCPLRRTHWEAETDEREQRVRAEGEDKREGALDGHQGKAVRFRTGRR